MFSIFPRPSLDVCPFDSDLGAVCLETFGIVDFCWYFLISLINSFALPNFVQILYNSLIIQYRAEGYSQMKMSQKTSFKVY